MTREEAIAAFTDAADPSSFRAASWIDRFVALGMLKFDEPEKSSPEAMLCDILYHEGLRGLAQRAVIDALHSAGLKVVHRTPQENEQ